MTPKQGKNVLPKINVTIIVHCDVIVVVLVFNVQLGFNDVTRILIVHFISFLSDEATRTIWKKTNCFNDVTEIQKIPF